MSDAPQRRKNAKDFDQRMLEIFDGYVHGKMTKREFISQAGKYAAAGVTGAMLLEQLAPNYALAQQVAPDDPEIETVIAEYDSPEGHGTMRGPDGQARRGRGAAAGGAGDPREPRAEPLYRGRRAAHWPRPATWPSAPTG